jgi:hypothetical protein
MTEGGIYNDDCDGWSPEEISEHYGVYGRESRRAPGQTGAGHPPDEDTDADGWVDEEPSTEAPATIPAVNVPEPASPFVDADEENAFWAALAIQSEQGFIPEGYGIMEDEWEEGEYPTSEVIQVGRRRSGELYVSLPLDVWLPRAELWVRALNLMITALEM